MAGIEVTNYSQLQATEIPVETNWTATGQGPNWTQIKDEKYGTIHHIKVTNPDGSSYDKLNIEWNPGVFIVVYRVNPEKNNQIEYFIPFENRVVLRDLASPDREQGSVWIRNIPQGGIKVWKDETPEEAALREIREETGFTPNKLTLMRDLYLDAANSESPMSFFLAEVDYNDKDYAQALESGEDIVASEKDWFTFKEFEGMQLQCGKTVAGIYLATGFLGAWNGTETPQEDLFIDTYENLTLGLI